MRDDGGGGHFSRHHGSGADLRRHENIGVDAGYYDSGGEPRLRRQSGSGADPRGAGGSRAGRARRSSDNSHSTASRSASPCRGDENPDDLDISNNSQDVDQVGRERFDEDAKLRQRRDARAEKSQAFREWLRHQRAKGGGRDPRGQDKRGSTSGPKERMEIHCPGFPVMASSPQAEAWPEEEALHRQQTPSEELCYPNSYARPAGCSVEMNAEAPLDYDSTAIPHTQMVATSGSSEPSFYGEASCRLVAGRSRSPPPPASWSVDGGPHPEVDQGYLPDYGEVSSGEMDVGDCQTDESMSTSVGDRIEGIRACLEARMGTQKFQKLYQMLQRFADEYMGDLRAAPCLSSTALSDALVEAFKVEDEKSDVYALVPLVAKLVACESSYFS